MFYCPIISCEPPHLQLLCQLDSGSSGSKKLFTSTWYKIGFGVIVAYIAIWLRPCFYSISFIILSLECIPWFMISVARPRIEADKAQPPLTIETHSGFHHTVKSLLSEFLTVVTSTYYFIFSISSTVLLVSSQLDGLFFRDRHSFLNFFFSYVISCMPIN